MDSYPGEPCARRKFAIACSIAPKPEAGNERGLDDDSIITEVTSNAHPIDVFVLPE